MIKFLIIKYQEACLSVPMDLANRWTDQVHINRVASHKSQEGLGLVWERVTPPSSEKFKKIAERLQCNKDRYRRDKILIATTIS